MRCAECFCGGSSGTCRCRDGESIQELHTLPSKQEVEMSWEGMCATIAPPIISHAFCFLVPPPYCTAVGAERYVFQDLLINLLSALIVFAIRCALFLPRRNVASTRRRCSEHRRMHWHVAKILTCAPIHRITWRHQRCTSDRFDPLLRLGSTYDIYLIFPSILLPGVNAVRQARKWHVVVRVPAHMAAFLHLSLVFVYAQVSLSVV